MRAIGVIYLVVAAILPSSTTAFVAPTPSISRRTSNVPSVNMMDPSHLWESASLLISGEDAVPAPGEVSYSKASYYTVLALYLMSFPGLWSQIKRSTTAKVKRKTYVR